MKLSLFRLTRTRSALLLGAGGILAAAVGVVPAQAATTFTDAAFSGSASGEAVHVDALSNSVAVDVAHGSSAVNSKGIAAAATDTETGTDVHLPINPALPTKNAYAFGKGLDAAGIAIADQAESSAPPNADPVQKEVAVPVSPLVYASASRGHAATKWNPNSCVIGSDLANGYGYVADAQLIGSGTAPAGGLTAPLVSTDTDPNTRDVVQSIARQFLTPNSQGNFGLASQVDTQLVPITLFKGTATEVTIEVAGDWVLTATATGIPGESKVTYKPSGATDDLTLPIITVIQTGVANRILSLGDLLGGKGLDIPIPGLADISIGEPPTSTISADGTTVTASADVVRVTLAGGTVADVLAGHASLKASVPSGGVTCPIPVSKKATPSIVNSTTAPDGNFQVAITITNGFDCPLTNLSATDEIIRKSGNVTFSILTADPRNDPKSGAGATFTTHSTTSATAAYTGLGTLAPGASKVLNVVLHVGTGTGEIQDTATAKGTLACDQGSAIGQASIDMTGSYSLITTVAAVLARTGGTQAAALLLGGVAASAVLTRRVLRTRRRQQSTSV